MKQTNRPTAERSRNRRRAWRKLTHAARKVWHALPLVALAALALFGFFCLSVLILNPHIIF